MNLLNTNQLFITTEFGQHETDKRDKQQVKSEIVYWLNKYSYPG